MLYLYSIKGRPAQHKDARSKRSRRTSNWHLMLTSLLLLCYRIGTSAEVIAKPEAHIKERYPLDYNEQFLKEGTYSKRIS